MFCQWLAGTPELQSQKLLSHSAAHAMFGVQDILLMVGPYGDWIKHNLESKTVLVSECDGIRLISAEQHELLSRVPDSLTDIFKIGSTAPGQHPRVHVCLLNCVVGPRTL